MTLENHSLSNFSALEWGIGIASGFQAFLNSHFFSTEIAHEFILAK